MTPDDFQQAWNTQPSGIHVKIDAKILREETQRFQKQLTTRLLWRDLREIGTAMLLIPLWLFLGLKLALPWTWYLTIPALIWFAGYMLVDRRRSKPRPEEPGDSLCRRLENTLDLLEGQIRLLKSVLWWGLLPLAVPMLAFVGHVAVLERTADLFSVIILWVAAPAIIGVVFFFVYWLNQHVVRTDLIPRRDELKKQLLSLQEESTDSESLTSD